MQTLFWAEAEMFHACQLRASWATAWALCHAVLRAHRHVAVHLGLPRNPSTFSSYNGLQHRFYIIFT